MKRKFLKKLKIIRPNIPPLNHERILQAITNTVVSISIPPILHHNNKLDQKKICRSPKTHNHIHHIDNHLQPQLAEEPAVDIDELVRELQDAEEEEEEEEEEEPTTPLCNDSREDKENRKPSPSTVKGWSSTPRKPLFDPDLLATFEKAVMDHILTHEAEKDAEAAVRAQLKLINGDDDNDNEEEEEDEEDDPLSHFEERCPPGGQDAVVLYTTSIRAIRKTFEECNMIRHVLMNLKVWFVERDVSMHMRYREELRTTLTTTTTTSSSSSSKINRSVVPPKLFIRGRYIGGADQVLGLHEQGKLVGLLKGIPTNFHGRRECCEDCGGLRFVLCLECRGSRKILDRKCGECNENGLIQCPLCC